MALSVAGLASERRQVASSPGRRIRVMPAGIPATLETGPQRHKLVRWGFRNVAPEETLADRGGEAGSW